ncbi:ferrous iron transport protein B [Acetivibrio straminisolvens JCM 21531]|uniref:Ferrous iron transport protein B n=1 Tax=Acetivibrio straminisolvens JCM 21531 TaxID=1294263 RepID=W4V1N4_9FIRM|nr:ferrous iron transport protein B [Acetivibrio straminisolvens JCM 21531]
MGLTSQSTGIGVLENKLTIVKSTPVDKVIALAGNPNVGKSTVFNSLTGLNQHTGNWPGKTVTNAQGKYRHKDKNFIMVDIPGTYSLMANSVEEEVARDFVCFGQPDATVVVTDATCLERNLNLVLQTLEITNKVVVCVNLIDEAERKKIRIDYNKLSKHLGVPVIPTNARSSKGLGELMDAVYDISTKDITVHPIKITYDDIVEEAIEMVQPKIEDIAGEKISSRWIALKLLDGDNTLLESLNNFLGFNLLDNIELAGLVDTAKNIFPITV